MRQPKFAMGDKVVFPVEMRPLEAGKNTRVVNNIYGTICSVTYDKSNGSIEAPFYYYDISVDAFAVEDIFGRVLEKHIMFDCSIKE